MVTMAWAGETFELHREPAVYWPARRAVVIADPHFGKAAAFRAGGVPIPGGTTADNLARLDAVLDRTIADRLIVLGDLLHAKAGCQPGVLDAVAAWRRRRASLKIDVIAGNHDRRAGDPPPAWRCTCHADPLAVGPLLMCHEPRASDRFHVLAGHLHPAVRLAGRARQSLRVPCFHFADRLAVLPAFGAFTGCHAVRPRPGDRVFAVGPASVVEVSAPPSRSDAAPPRSTAASRVAW